MLGMVGALLVIWVGIHILSGGLFLTPRNLWNLSVQTSSVAIMATGMVLVIVIAQHRPFGRLRRGVIGMIMGVAQAEFLIRVIGFQLGNPWLWIIALAVGVVLGLLIGAFQGFIIAYLEVPAFIVTLGGLLVWRGMAWLVTSGRTVAPLDATFQLMGGGPRGSIGATASWIVGDRRLRGGCLRAAQRPRRSASGSAFRCARSGPRPCLAWSLARPSSAPSGSPIPIPGRSASCASMRSRTASPFPKAGCSSPMASPYRC